jgi:hypothetical protein
MPASSPARDRAIDSLVANLVLESGDDGATHVLIRQQLDRATYESVDRLLRFAGGRWTRQKQAHVFPSGLDAKAAIDAALRQKAYLDDNPRDFFPTPGHLADEMIDSAVDEFLLFQLQEHPEKRVRVLEPSTGRGALIQALYRVIPASRVDLVAFEIDQRHLPALEAIGVAARNEDFLSAPVGAPVDLVLMNPPFAQKGHKEGWFAHIQQAMRWLRPGGKLAAVVPPAIDRMIGRRPDDSVVDLLALVHATGEIAHIEEGTFAGNDRHAPSTNIATRLITLEIPTAPAPRTQHQGWNGRFTWQTALVIDNNSEPLREAAIWGGNPDVLPTPEDIHRRLLEQRPLWVGHHAPWVRDGVDVREIAEHLADIAREHHAHRYGTDPDDPPTCQPPPPAAAPETLPLFAFAAEPGDRAA